MTVKKLALLLPLFLLAACGEEPAPAPTPTATPEPVVTLTPPDQDLLGELLAEACPGIEPVSTAVCRRGMGAETVACEYGLGEDEFLRNDATLAVNEAGDGWMIEDPEAVCAQ
jgi:hypothetical protein